MNVARPLLADGHWRECVLMRAHVDRAVANLCQISHYVWLKEKFRIRCAAGEFEKLRIGKRNAREGEMEDYLAAIVRANRAIQDMARGKVDVPCTQALPKDLGEWRPAVEFVLGPFGCGKNLDEISAIQRQPVAA